MLLLSWHLIHMYTRQLLLVFLETCLQCKLFEVNNNLGNLLAFIYSNEAIMQSKREFPPFIEFPIYI